MGIGYALKHLATGDFKDAFNGFWVSDDLLAAQNSESDNLSKIIARQQADGLVSAEQATGMYSLLSPNTNSEAYWGTMGSTPFDEFSTALEEQAAKIGSLGSSAINKTLGIGFKLIPWQVYVLGGVLVLIWLYPLWKPFAGKLMTGKT